MLSGSEENRALQALARVAGDHRPVDPPRAAAAGIRWKDVPLAMHYATADVEMAVARTIEQPGAYEFVLRTVDDRPGRITVRRTGDDRVYVAEAEIGRFADDASLAAALRAAFDRQMRAFGRKRRLAYEVD